MKSKTFLLGCAILLGVAHAETASVVNLAPAGIQPQIAVSPQGDIDVVFARDGGIYFSNSIDHGQTFSEPSKVAEVTGLMAGMRRGPRVAATANRILVTAPAEELGSYVSDDGGKTWTKLPKINDRSGTAKEGLQNITALPDGSFYAVWLDSRTGQNQVEGARLDAGATEWGANVSIYTSPEKSVCPCCHPSVVSDDKGKLTVMWRNSLDGNRDFYFSESTDRGDSFSTATKLGNGSWKLNVCPMDGGNLVATPDAGVFTIWKRNNEVYMDQPGQPEIKLGQGAQPVVTKIGGKIVCIWQAQGRLVVADASGQPQAGTFTGAYPAVAASPDGHEGYLVWEGGDAGKVQLAVLH